MFLEGMNRKYGLRLVNTWRAEIFAEQIFEVDWSKTFKFQGINFRDSAIYLNFYRIDFPGWCLEGHKTKQLEAKSTKNVRYFPSSC